MRDLLDWLELTEEQRAAVTPRDVDLMLTAGAGTGKTRTLVARYLSLLADGVAPRRIVAITFTEKAAREMRNRIRQRIAAWLEELESDEERRRWRASMRAMESARIGTIHSLCAEILRTHPAAARLDPEFEVLDEGAAALLRTEAVDQAAAEAANDPELALLFNDFSVWGLRRLLLRLMEVRLDVEAALGEGSAAADSGLAQALREFAEAPQVAAAVGGLRRLKAEGYFETEATGAMAAMGPDLLAAWERFEAGLTAGRWTEAAAALFECRRHLRGGVGREDGSARRHVDALRTAYEGSVGLWLGGASASDPPPDPALEGRYQQVQTRVTRLIERALAIYQESLRQRASLDFDSLEALAVRLLADPIIRRHWQAALDHVLVDEFQDTNGRQQRIVEALTSGGSGQLFVVGDARQSIYRFRGADVTVFRRMSEGIGTHGRALELRRTFRQHRQLLDHYDRLLPPIMNSGPEPAERFQIAYTPLAAERSAPLETSRPPFLEFLLGLGSDAADGRATAAAALAARLRELQAAGELLDWDQVALLFRASSGFAPYEDAFEAYGLPYVTVAGRGFYDRPEVREILNALRALAEPWNDAALAGLLRSSLVGMSDGGLYQLRVGTDGLVPFRRAVEQGAAGLSGEDETARLRAGALLTEIGPLVDRLPVVDSLKRLIDFTDARAVMAIAGQRQWTNLDKLLEDARASQTTRVRGFLDYLRATREAGVREGEAPAEGQGAIRLMTVHRAKGLEFDYVVLADAGYSRGMTSDAAYVSPGFGLAVRPDLWDGVSLHYRLARAADHAREAAEEARLLYVAATRAREKWIVSGHLTEGSRGRRVAGWLAQLLAAAALEANELQPGVQTAPSDSQQAGVRLEVALEPPPLALTPGEEEPAWPAAKDAQPLYDPIHPAEDEQTDEGYDEPAPRDWRATGRVHPPAVVVGEMVHRAIERWLFPPDPGVDRLLEASALAQGLVEPAQRQAAIQRSRQLLERLRRHPLWEQIEASDERYHELPYTYQPPGGATDSGDFDLLYRAEGQWWIVDFKTDSLSSEDELRKAIERHREQLERYDRAGRALLEGPVTASIVFLDDRGQIRLERPV